MLARIFKFLFFTWSICFLANYYVTQIRGFEVAGFEAIVTLIVVAMVMIWAGLMGWILRVAFS